MNLGEIQSYISARLIDPNNQSVSLATITQAVNQSIEYYKITRFWFNEVRDSATLTAGNAVIPLPDNFLFPFSDDDGFAIFYSDTRYPLVKITAQQYDGYFLSNGTGLPRFYARLGNEYHTWWVPDQNYTIQRHYIKDYDALSATSDTNDFTDHASRMICMWTLANLSAELRQDDKMEAYYRSAADAEFVRLCQRGNKSNGTGKLTLSSSLLTA